MNITFEELKEVWLKQYMKHYIKVKPFAISGAFVAMPYFNNDGYIEWIKFKREDILGVNR